MRAACLALPLTACLLLLAAPAGAVELRWGGALQTDVRARVEEKRQGDYHSELVLPVGLVRNEQALTLKLDALGERFAGIAELDFVWRGQPAGLEGLEHLADRSRTSSMYLETEALYIEAWDVFTEGLDLRIGQQKVLWGVGDQFNPTNNLNAEDLEDPLLFGDQQANMMVRADWGLSDTFTLTGVLIPIFQPAQLPASGLLGLAATERLPFVEEQVLLDTASQSGLAGHFGLGQRVSGTQVRLPETSLSGMQYALKLEMMLGEQDVSLSWFDGRTDMPVPMRTDVALTPLDEPVCDPDDESKCVTQLIDTEATLGYPRVRIVGFNTAGELDWFGSAAPLGWRLEAALFLPDAVEQSIVNDGSMLALSDDLPDVSEELVVEDTPFLKWSLGLDYTLGEYVYANVQWVHGLVDEYGAGDWLSPGSTVVRDSGVRSDLAQTSRCAIPFDHDGDEATPKIVEPERCPYFITRPRLADYLVAGLDLRFSDQQGLLRLFIIWDVGGYEESEWDEDAGAREAEAHAPWSKEGFSMVFFPQLGWNFGEGLEMSAGAIVKLGRDYTKFGDPAAGGTLAWTRARYSF